MDKSLIARVFSYSLIALLVLNMVFFALGKFSQTIFWSIIAISALFAFVILPNLRGEVR